MKTHAVLSSKCITRLLLAVANVFVAMQVVGAPPNILMIVVDDMDGTAPGIFGGVFAPDVMPHIDRLASQGMRFEKAHVTVAVCQPSRQTIMTGKFPPHIGAMGFTPIDDDITTLGQLLSKAGYVNGTYNKLLHLEPRHSFAWDYTKNGNEASQGRSVVRTRQMTEEFIDLANAKKAPFFLMANTADPHAPFYMSKKELSSHPKAYLPLAEGGMEFGFPSKLYTEDDISLPAFLVDTGDTLEEVTQYVNSCRRADDIVGEILLVLEEKGKTENTIVLFLSDNGMPFESAKHNTYFQSTKTPLIIRWPGHIAKNTLNDTHFVSGIDLMPTLLDAVGIDIPTDLDGSSFLPLLEGKDMAIGDRDVMVTTHFETVAYINAAASPDQYRNFLDMGYVVSTSRALTRPKNMRCVQSEGYGYVYNATDTGFSTAGRDMTLAAMAGLTPAEWWDHREDFLAHRGPEEFYDFSIDPNGLNNLINDPAYADLIHAFRLKLLSWMEKIKDPSLAEYQHLYNQTTPEMYLKFANLADGHVFALGDPVLSNIELEYIILEYVEVMTLLVDGVRYEELVRAPFEYDLSKLSAGKHTLRMQLEDKTGHVTLSDEITITIEGDAVVPRTPMVEFVELSDGDTIPLGENINITATASAIRPADIKTIKLLVDGTYHTKDSEAPYTFNVTGLSAGRHSFRLWLLDAHGDWTSAKAINITVTERIP